MSETKISELDPMEFSDVEGLGEIPVAIGDVGTYRVKIREFAKRGYTHTQTTPADIWVINHNLGYRPHITVSLEDGSEVGCEKKYVNDNTVTINLAVSISGIAYLS